MCSSASPSSNVAFPPPTILSRAICAHRRLLDVREGLRLRRRHNPQENRVIRIGPSCQDVDQSERPGDETSSGLYSGHLCRCRLQEQRRAKVKERKGEASGHLVTRLTLSHHVQGFLLGPFNLVDLSASPLVIFVLLSKLSRIRSIIKGDHHPGICGNPLATRLLIFIWSLGAHKETVLEWACWCPGFLPVDRASCPWIALIWDPDPTTAWALIESRFVSSDIN